MASVTTSTFVALPEGRHKQHAGTFEPSTELLDKLRGLLVSPPAAASRSYKTTPVAQNKEYYWKLPFQPDQRKSQSVHRDSGIDLAPRSSIQRSKPRDIQAVKTHRSHRHSPKQSRSIRRSSNALPHLIHPNVLDPWDDLPDEGAGYALTFSSTVSLDRFIYRFPRMSSEDADSYFKQAILGLDYIHRCGVGHQDIRPENLIITINNVLKISNFDGADFSGHSKSDDRITRRKNNFTSAEYIAPEVFVESSYDPKAVDMWAIGLVYMEMRRGGLFWNIAAEGADESYDRYLQDRVGLWGFRPIENLSNEHCRRVITSLLDPVPERRYTASRVLRSTWCSSIQLSSFILNETP